MSTEKEGRNDTGQTAEAILDDQCEDSTLWIDQRKES